MTSVVPIPTDEPARLAALQRLHLLDTPPEDRFDRLIRRARAELEVPIALISLVDTDRLWFKSCQGLTVSNSPRDTSFCAYTILQMDTLVIPDATEDPRFQNSPLVAGPPFLRSYAGRPLHSPDGYRVGTLCVIDLVPRQFSPEQIQNLEELAGLVEIEVQQVRQQRGAGAPPL